MYLATYLACAISDWSCAGQTSCQQILILSGESLSCRCSLPHALEDSNSEFEEYLQKVTNSFVFVWIHDPRHSLGIPRGHFRTYFRST